MPRKSDLIGMKFGLLKVIERTKERENGYYVWLCKCQCGGEVYVNTKHILRGTVTNCGCIPKSAARRGSSAENLCGQRFGEWEVLQRAENRKSRVMWMCRCSCGTIKTIAARDLKAGKTHSCRNPIHTNLYNRRDLTGQTFGNLKILYPTKQRNYKGSVIWHCYCEKCGREKDFSEDDLLHGKRKSCGCNQFVYAGQLIEHRHFYNGTCVETLSRKLRSDNKSGSEGVYKRKNGNYTCSITFQGTRYHLGTHKKYNEAVLVREKAKKMLHEAFIDAYTSWTKSKDKKELIFDVSYVNGEFLIQSNYLPECH